MTGGGGRLPTDEEQQQEEGVHGTGGGGGGGDGYLRAKRLGGDVVACFFMVFRRLGFNIVIISVLLYDV